MPTIMNRKALCYNLLATLVGANLKMIVQVFSLAFTMILCFPQLMQQQVHNTYFSDAKNITTQREPYSIHVYCSTDHDQHFSNNRYREQGEVAIPDHCKYISHSIRETANNGNNNSHRVVFLRRPSDQKIIGLRLEVEVEPKPTPFAAGRWRGAELIVRVDCP